MKLGKREVNKGPACTPPGGPGGVDASKVNKMRSEEEDGAEPQTPIGGARRRPQMVAYAKSSKRSTTREGSGGREARGARAMMCELVVGGERNNFE